MPRVEASRTLPISVKEGFDYITQLRNWRNFGHGYVGIDDEERASWSKPGDELTLRVKKTEVFDEGNGEPIPCIPIVAHVRGDLRSAPCPSCNVFPRGGHFVNYILGDEVNRVTRAFYDELEAEPGEPEPSAACPA